ncbi:acetyl-coenzyme A synthetase, cytoplasmic-like protein [Sarcoptes scabiei]|uniref:Acetyl-coenzyme A synthetase n=1 Tax=Sarcoptes scabiei TaxID=52283 RepID=A0A132AH34_SARSC|nr:acetyl-coenzyme A synthetase, cytoplasmic-like protein [Sarcoptes scabiei]
MDQNNNQFFSPNQSEFIRIDNFEQHHHYVKSFDHYKQLWEESIREPQKFWRKIAENFYWNQSLPELDDEATETDRLIFRHNFDTRKNSIKIEFLPTMSTNITYNLLDRHCQQGHGDRIAYHWEGNELNETKSITYAELKDQVCRFANVLKQFGIEKGDRVAIYLPVTIELVIAMLACARIGAIHAVVFAGFSAHSLAERLICANVKILIAANASFRGEKFLHFQPIVDEAVEICLKRNLNLRNVIIVDRFVSSLNRNRSDYEDRVAKHQSPIVSLCYSWSELISNVSNECEPVWLNAEHPLFILYTSGSTGKPKGVLHTVGGYMLTTALVFKYAFNYEEKDIFFCTADIGWITGHTANVYGPLANAATSILFEGIPTYPKANRLWRIVDERRATILYTAPTAVRSLMKFDEKLVNSYAMDHLKLIALVGEPINREAWLWLYRLVGKERCPIVDTYFQTETVRIAKFISWSLLTLTYFLNGAPMIFPIPYIIDMKPGSATVPFFGILPVILDENGKEISTTDSGFLAFKQAWPGIARTIDGDHRRFQSVYFEKFPGYYFTGDAAYRDRDGYFWITGRTDDLLNVSGHLLSTSEVESAFLIDGRIAEAAAVAMPHEIKGQCICVYVVCKNGCNYTKELEQQLKILVRKEIGPVATPDLIINVQALPKTRSGKIMRRILAKIACNQNDFGDISTITDEKIIDDLIRARQIK